VSNAAELPGGGGATSEPGAWAADLLRGDFVLWLVEVPGGIEDARGVSREISDDVSRHVGHTASAATPPMRSLHVSRSATAGLAGVAMSLSAALGVDVERIRSELVDADLLALVLHPHERSTLPADHERAFFSLWTRKEAVLKALGTGLSRPPHSVDVGWGGEAGRWQAVESCHVCSITAPPGFAAALATSGRPGAVRLRAWKEPAGG
jgi:4'-phosphopantetheinyl transferase